MIFKVNEDQKADDRECVRVRIYGLKLKEIAKGDMLYLTRKIK
jgi:hypothetical protein